MEVFLILTSYSTILTLKEVTATAMVTVTVTDTVTAMVMATVTDMVTVIMMRSKNRKKDCLKEFSQDNENYLS